MYPVNVQDVQGWRISLIKHLIALSLSDQHNTTLELKSRLWPGGNFSFVVEMFVLTLKTGMYPVFIPGF